MVNTLAIGDVWVDEEFKWNEIVMRRKTVKDREVEMNRKLTRQICGLVIAELD